MDLFFKRETVKNGPHHHKDWVMVKGHLRWSWKATWDGDFKAKIKIASNRGLRVPLLTSALEGSKIRKGGCIITER